ncbi:MAG: kelch repeat-containing protein [Chloroflexi bacterium]|nr:kelch repeat-containing protein [Chloroflexota bacterium]MCI0649926.1 kelch repeat-containing protein [Chloroflexota bacterium]MCI0729839.1 kelch repeat-containing protein [Chloroflexota bacterium]
MKNNNRAEAERLLRAAVAADERDLAAWAGLSLVLPTAAEQRYCLEKLLALDPDNAFARNRPPALAQPATTSARPVAPAAEAPTSPAGPDHQPTATPGDEPAAAPPAADMPAITPLREPNPVRRVTFAFVRRLFAPAYLPAALVWLAMLLMATAGVFTLVGQAPAYWLNHSQAHSGEQVIDQLLVAGPWLFLAAWLGYTLLVGLLLTLLNRNLALLLWTGLSFFHLRHNIIWTFCAFGRALRQPFTTACGSPWLLLSLLGVAVLGLVLAGALFRPAQPRPSRRLHAGRLAAVAWSLLLVAMLASASQPPRQGWAPLTIENVPPGRIYGQIAYDTERDLAILFGGADAYLTGGHWQTMQDTWIWDGQVWQQANPAQQPPGRAKHAMVYDERRGVVVLFGGIGPGSSYLTDTWEWDGQAWQRMTPDIAPPARCCHQLIFDPQRQKVVLYGGLNEPTGVFFNDAWEWDGQNWQPIPLTGSPLAAGFGLVYDSQQNRALAYVPGGASATWVWQQDQWSPLALSPVPVSRTDLSMVYDRNTGQTLLFGGFIPEGIRHDTWLFDGTAWQELQTPLFPSGRWGQVMFYDETRGRFLLFGGFDGENYLNDMWELALPQTANNP